MFCKLLQKYDQGDVSMINLWRALCQGHAGCCIEIGLPLMEQEVLNFELKDKRIYLN